MGDEAFYVFRVSFQNMFTEMPHIQSNNELWGKQYHVKMFTRGKVVQVFN
jgi:hypothetical protein